MILASERAPPPSMRTEEVLDDEEIIEADRDVGATMSDRVRRHSGSGAFACVWTGADDRRLEGGDLLEERKGDLCV